jgi:hypothetical protein
MPNNLVYYVMATITTVQAPGACTVVIVVYKGRVFVTTASITATFVANKKLEQLSECVTNTLAYYSE